jgi:hypothetical protein
VKSRRASRSVPHTALSTLASLIQTEQRPPKCATLAHELVNLQRFPRQKARMFFDQLPFSKIPIWENRYRLKVLIEFRRLLDEYAKIFLKAEGIYASMFEYNRDDPALVQHRSWLNQRLPIAYRVVLLTGVNPVIRRYNVQYDLLKNVFTDPSGKDLQLAFDLIDQAMGVYQADKPAAWFRTFSPFFWFGLLADWIAEIPFRILRKLGLGAADTSRGPARFFRGIFSLLVWLIGLAGSVFGILEFFGLREAFLKLISWK